MHASTHIARYDRLAAGRFQFREFAWWPIGKIAYLITSLFRQETVLRNSRGEISAFYMALCTYRLARQPSARHLIDTMGRGRLALRACSPLRRQGVSR